MLDFLSGLAVLVLIMATLRYLYDHRGKGDGDVRKGWPVD